MTAAALASAPLAVACASECDCTEWDSFVRGHPGGTLFHLTGWPGAVRDAYGFDAHYITARRGGALTGILAVNDIRAPLSGRSLVSGAFCVGGGPLGNDAETRIALLDAAEQLAVEKGVHHLECRSDADAPGWKKKTGTHAYFQTPIIRDETEALRAVPRKRRAEIRKALDMAATGALNVRHDGDADIFYSLYARSLRKLGTPVFPRRFLNSLLSAFSSEAEISIVEGSGEPVAALVSFYFGTTVLPYYVGADDRARQTRAFDFLYWSVMRRAAEKGCTVFDFGRSRIDSGAYAYKRFWGIEPAPVIYRDKRLDGKAAPDVGAANPTFAAFSKLWPHLPLALTNRLGPWLAPNFP